jgi:hypothetical protein
MNVDTRIDRARKRVRGEREAVDAKIEALDAFVGRIEELAPDPNSAASSVTATVGAQSRVASAADSRCRRVRTAFAETIRPHSVDDTDGDEPLLETIREEFTETIAVALAPTTDAPFTPGLKRAIVAQAEARRAEATAFARALDRETDQLDAAGETVDEITGWIGRSEEPPPSDVGFNALKLRHETLERHRNRCETLARDRQEFLGETTNNGIEAGIRHRQLMPYLYATLSVDHPVLATVVRLDAACEEYQRIIRDHLTRRR